MSKLNLLLASLIVLSFMSPVASGRDVVGWVENVRLLPADIKIKAKVDTGAKTSSLHCKCIHPIKREGRDWVSFGVENESGDVVHIEKPVHRIAEIKRHFGKKQTRYVVKLGVCMGSTYREADVTLVDRSGYNYQMLIGRNFMKSDFLVDPGSTFLKKPDCKRKH